MAAYWLAQHVYLCRASDGVILLDLRNDRYLGLDSVSARLAGTLVNGWPLPSESAVSDADSTEASAIAQRLLEQGLFTRNAVAGKPATPIAIERPSTTLCEEDPRERPHVGLRHTLHFLLATSQAAALLRWRPIDRIVGRVQRRKNRRRGNARHCMSRAPELVAAFEALRPFSFTAKNECLFHALALLEFLARYGLHPDWVFGVQTGPFAAHCWVQHEAIVFNDFPEHVRRYTPIMAV